MRLFDKRSPPRYLVRELAFPLFTEAIRSSYGFQVLWKVTVGAPLLIGDRLGLVAGMPGAIQMSVNMAKLHREGVILHMALPGHLIMEGREVLARFIEFPEQKNPGRVVLLCGDHDEGVVTFSATGTAA